MSPSSRPSNAPAGLPPSGSNAKYAVVALVLVGGLIALVAFKQCGAKPPQPVVVFDAAPTPHENPDDNLPPPPDLEDASAAPLASQRPGYFDPCAVRGCSGKTTPEVENALAFRAKQAHRCYDMALTQDPELKGHVSITVRVAQNGQVCAANITDNDMGTASVANCVLNMFRSAGHFPPPKGGCVDAKVPISFIPGGK